MSRKSLRIAALVLAVIVVLGALYGPKVLRWQQSQRGQGGSVAVQGQHKPVYYYDAMNPQNHYSKPGKAPDGMDLVPQYAEEGTRGEPTTPAAASTDRKVLYWYDPMHPAYKSDKPGIAPDCGMQLVPVYADGSMGGSAGGTAGLPPGTVNVSAEKQQLIGVKISTVEKAPGTHTLRVLGRVVP